MAALGWPEGWEGYVGEVGGLSKDEFEDAIRADMATRPPAASGVTGSPIAGATLAAR